MLWEVVQEPVVHLNASLQDLKNISAREVWTYCASARFAMCEVIAPSKFTGSVSQETVTTIRSTYSQTIWSPSLVNVLTCIVYSTIGMHFFFMESSFCFRDTAKNPRIMSPKTTHTECFFFVFYLFILFYFITAGNSGLIRMYAQLQQTIQERWKRKNKLTQVDGEQPKLESKACKARVLLKNASLHSSAARIQSRLCSCQQTTDVFTLYVSYV